MQYLKKEKKNRKDKIKADRQEWKKESIQSPCSNLHRVIDQSGYSNCHWVWSPNRHSSKALLLSHDTESIIF